MYLLNDLPFSERFNVCPQGCREKAQTLPVRLDTSTLPQLKALQSMMEYIFDRNASLLPAYFIVTEIQKAYPDSNNWPHWVCYFLMFLFYGICEFCTHYLLCTICWIIQ